MLKKSITFENLDGVQVTKVFYFNLNKSELAELELGAAGGSLATLLQEIIKKNDASQIIQTFKDLIGKSYGVRDEDGVSFRKSDELTDAFLHTDAYSELFMELVTNATAAGEFINGVVPTSLRGHLEKATGKNEFGVSDEVAAAIGADLNQKNSVDDKPPTVTREQLMSMSTEEFANWRNSQTQ